MRRKLIGGLTTIALIAIVAGTMTLGNASPTARTIPNGWMGTATTQSSLGRSALPRITGAETVHVILHQTNITFTDVGAPGPSIGDTIEVSGPLLNADRTKTVGFMAGHCTVTNPERRFLTECELTANLGGSFPQGNQLTVQGFSNDATHWFNAVTGGAGRYGNVRGTVEARNISTTPYIDLVFRLIP